MTSTPRGSFDRKFVPLSARFDHALLFAAQVHREQDRKKSGIPYLSHLLGVASITEATRRWRLRRCSTTPLRTMAGGRC